VATIDPAAFRNTQDVDILFRRGDFDAGIALLDGRRFRWFHGLACRSRPVPERVAEKVQPLARAVQLDRAGFVAVHLQVEPVSLTNRRARRREEKKEAWR
jgi:hypothetical protein